MKFIKDKKRLLYGAKTTLFISPSLVLYLTLVVVPSFISLYYSFTSWDGYSLEATYVGLENFRKLFSDQDFLRGIRNNFFFLFFNGSIVNTLSLFLAMALNVKLKGHKIFRAIFFLPFVLTPVALGLAFIYLLHPDKGILQGTGIILLGYPTSALFSLAFVHMWGGFGVTSIIWLAGLRNIDNSIKDAALVDGVNKFQMTFRIILPLLTPSIIIITILTIIGNFRIFDIPLMMTGGGPANSTTFASLFIFQNAFKYFRYGYSMAATTVVFVIPLFFISLAYTLIQQSNRRRLGIK